MDAAYALTPTTLDDVPDVLVVTREVETATVGETLLDADDVRGFWRDPTFDPEQDSRLVRLDGRPVAMAAAFANGYVHAAVVPGHRGRGIGTALADWAERRQRERGLRRCDQEAFVGDAETSAFLAGRGYQPAHESWELELDPDATIVPHVLPAGVQVRPMRPDEERATYQVIEDAFGEWEGREPRPFDSWRALVVERPGMTEDHLLVAVRDGQVVGACIGMDSERPDEAWVAQLAVRRDQRGQGLAQQLLAESFGRARRRGRPRGRLSTDSRTGALGLYERLGMRVTHTFRAHHLDL